MAARNPGVEFGKQMIIIDNSLIVMRISVGDGRLIGARVCLLERVLVVVDRSRADSLRSCRK